MFSCLDMAINHKVLLSSKCSLSLTRYPEHIHALEFSPLLSKYTVCMYFCIEGKRFVSVLNDKEFVCEKPFSKTEPADGNRFPCKALVN